jgi:hypothetical protein
VGVDKNNNAVKVLPSWVVTLNGNPWIAPPIPP